MLTNHRSASMMHTTQQEVGIPGILRPFKDYLEGLSLTTGTQVVFFGLPGTCLPFVELLCYAVRTLPITPVFVPVLNTTKARAMVYDEAFGFQVGEPITLSNTPIFVLMGGLSMPVSKVTSGDANALIATYNPSRVLGISFMSMFEKTGWITGVSFDLLIDATVTVTILKSRSR